MRAGLKSTRYKFWGAGAAVAVFAVAGVYLVVASHAATAALSAEPETGSVSSPAAKVGDSAASGGAAVQFKAPAGVGGGSSSCAVTAMLVNPCHPWLGGESSNYGGIANNPKDQDLAQEARIGRQLQMVHTYHPVGSNTLSFSDKYFINRPDTVLYTTWKPAAKFSTAASSSSDSAIDAMANSIKSVAPKKVILGVYHEPENDVSSGTSCATASGASAGSPTDYINMWHHVRQRFDAAGVTNVVWAINFMGFKKWNDCGMVKSLWPGNSYVDWIFWDPYSHDGNFNSMISTFYNWMTQNSDASHDYLSKVWGVAEWNIWYTGTTRQQQIDLYNSAKASVEANTWPRIRAYNVFDSLSNCIASSPCSNKTKTPPILDSGVLGAYKAYANSSAFQDR